MLSLVKGMRLPLPPNQTRLVTGLLISAGLVSGVQSISLPNPVTLDDFILQVNRNARQPTMANHGARPNSSFMRRLRKTGSYQKWREKTVVESEENNPKHGHLEGEDDIEGTEPGKPATPATPAK